MIMGNIDMNSISNRIIVTGALYAVIFASGFLLARSGSPYSTILLTVHKLVSVAAIVLLYKSFSAVHQTYGLNTPAIIVGVVAGLVFIGTIATGGLISIGGEIPEIVYSVHRVMPVMNVISVAVSLYLLNNIR